MPKPPQKPDKSRQDRRAAALKANLKRRKLGKLAPDPAALKSEGSGGKPDK
jgi:hypothetical protein